MLLHIPDLLDTDQIAQFRQALEAGDWTDGQQTVGPQGAQVKRNRQLAEASPLRHRLGRVVLESLANNPLYFSAVLPQRTLPPRFNRYEGGGHYGFHVDGAVMAMRHSDETTSSLRTDVSCTLFLSDPDTYDGGELIVNDTYGEHEVKLPAGDLIVYPSSSLHRVMPVTRGTRLASIFWVQSLVRDDARRQLLFELDASIQRLTSPAADRDAVLRLTGVYHNLLRQWAET